MSLPSSVKSVVLTKTGDFDAISQIDLPFPSQAKDEILVKVSAPSRVLELVVPRSDFGIAGSLWRHQLH